MAFKRSLSEKRNDNKRNDEALKPRSSSPIRKKYRAPQKAASKEPQASFAFVSSAQNPSQQGIKAENTLLSMSDIKVRTRKRNFHPSFLAHLAHLAQPLRPFISVTTGLSHPSFPASLLIFNLLTSAELDVLAAYYHQFIPATRETSSYPVRIPAWVDRHGHPLLDIPIETKRRLFGQFIGLVGPDESSLEEGQAVLLAVEREWQALARARSGDEDGGFSRKIGGYF